MQGQTIYLIDTPGFNDSNRSDVAILKEIAFLLCQIYRHGLKLAGIVYLHRISDNRLSGSAMRNLDLLKRICGPQAAPHVFLVSTMWDQVDDAKIDASEAWERESELKARDCFWGSLCQQGSQVKRSQGDKRSALAVLNDLVALCHRSGYATMQIQEELVDQCKGLNDTLAGQEILATYQRTEQKYAEELDLAVLGVPRESSDDAIAVAKIKRELQAAKRGQEELRINWQGIVAEKERVYAQYHLRIHRQRERIGAKLSENDRKFKQLELDHANLLSTFEKHKQEWQREHAALKQDVRQGCQARRALEDCRERIETESLRIAKNLEETKKVSEREKARIEEDNRVLKKRDVVKKNLLPLVGIMAGAGVIAAGAITGVTPLLGLGAQLAFENARNLKFSRRHKDGEGKDDPKVSLSALSGVST